MWVEDGSYVWVAPVAKSTTPKEDAAASRALNAHLMERADAGAGVDYLAAPQLGAAISVPRIEQMFIRAMLANAKSPAETVGETLAAQGQFLIVEGETIEDKERTKVELTKMFDGFKAQKASLLKRLGVY